MGYFAVSTLLLVHNILYIFNTRCTSYKGYLPEFMLLKATETAFDIKKLTLHYLVFLASEHKILAHTVTTHLLPLPQTG